MPVLQALILPDLSPLDAAAREQIQAAYMQVQDMADLAAPDRAALASAQGQLGTLLLAYDQPGSEAALANAEALQPTESRWPYYIGLARRLAGDFDGAHQAYERALQLQPDDIAVRFRVAQMDHELGRDDEAATLLNKVIADAPNTAIAHKLLGEIAAMRDDPAAAITHYEAVLALQPKASSVHSPLALAYGKIGDSAKAREHRALIGTAPPTIDDPLQRDLEQLKVGPSAWIIQADHALDIGDPVAAATLATKALSQDAGAVRAYLYLGDARADLGDREGAIEAYQKAAALDPSNDKIHAELGKRLAESGLLDAAEAAYHQALKQDPTNADASLGLAELLRRSGRFEAALSMYAAALKSPTAPTTALVQKVFCLVNLGRYAEALTDLEAGLKRSPGDLDILDALARILATAPDEDLRDGQMALSIAQALRQKRQGTDALETEAMALAAAGDFDAAARQQALAIASAEEDGATVWLDSLRVDWVRYQRHERAAAPWPPFVLMPAPPAAAP